MADKPDYRLGLSYSFPMSLHSKLQATANALFGGNRTMAAEYYVDLGKAAEAAGFTVVQLLGIAEAARNENGPGSPTDEAAG